MTIVRCNPAINPPLPRRLFRAAAAAVVGAMCMSASLLAQVVPSEMPPPVRGLEVNNKLGQQIPLHLQFKDQTGKTVSLGSYFNRPTADGKGKKPVVIQMQYFRCPILCPTVLEKFTRTLNQLDFTVGSEFDALIISFDHRDQYTDAASHRLTQLASYDRPQTESVIQGWNYLVGAPETSRELADALGFPYRWLPESDEYSHGAVVFVLTPEGKISRYLTGLGYPAKDVRLALVEASSGKIGTVFDAFTLWCYHFDPNLGSYTPQAMRIMQLVSAATVLSLGGLLIAMQIHERRRRRQRSQGPPPPGGPRPLPI